MTPSDFRMIFPEFSGESDSRLQTFINLADPYFDELRWGDFLTEGKACFVAHRLSMSNGTAGNVNGKKPQSNALVMRKVGDVSAQYSEALLMKQAQNTYFATQYGQRYWQLVEQVGSGFMVV